VTENGQFDESPRLRRRAERPESVASNDFRKKDDNEKIPRRGGIARHFSSSAPCPQTYDADGLQSPVVDSATIYNWTCLYVGRQRWLWHRSRQDTTRSVLGMMSQFNTT